MNQLYGEVRVVPPNLMAKQNGWVNQGVRIDSNSLSKQVYSLLANETHVAFYWLTEQATKTSN